MGVLSVTTKIASDLGARSPDNKTFQTTARLTQDVMVSDPANDDQNVVLSDLRVVQIRSPNPGGGWLRCDNVNARKMSPFRYEVDSDFSSPSKPGKSPLDNPPDFKFGYVTTEEEFDMDADQQPIIFYATGERPNPHIREPVYDDLITVKRNLPTVDPVLLSTYRRAVSSDYWYGFPPGTVRVVTLEANSVNDDTFSYFSVDAAFQVRRGAPRTTDLKAWYRRVLAQGMKVNRQKPGTAGVFPADFDLGVKGWDAKGKDTTEPVMHAIVAGPGAYTGKTYFVGQQIDANDWRDAQWYEYKIFNPLPIAALGAIATLT
jgi:hypothetical protein